MGEYKKIVLIIVLSTGVVGCTKTKSEVVERIRRAEKLVLTKPDSALMMLNGIKVCDLRARRSLAKFRLLRSIAENRLGIPTESPEDIAAAQKYFSRIVASDSLQAVAYLNLGRAYERAGQPREAFVSYLSAEFSVNNTSDNRYWKHQIYYRIAYLYFHYFDNEYSPDFTEYAVDYLNNSRDSVAMNLKFALDALGENKAHETKLREILLARMEIIRKMVDCYIMYSANPRIFRRKVQALILETDKDSSFGGLQQVVDEKYGGIIRRLKERHPELSDCDLNLCCLICFGFNSIQIGILFGHDNHKSIFNNRYKLRQKMGIGTKFSSLEAYLEHEMKAEDCQ